jgi:hypothetical protein
MLFIYKVESEPALSSLHLQKTVNGSLATFLNDALNMFILGFMKSDSTTLYKYPG